MSLYGELVHPWGRKSTFVSSTAADSNPHIVLVDDESNNSEKLT